MNHYTDGMKEGRKLFFLSKMEAQTQRLAYATRRRQIRQYWLASIQELQENGEIVLAAYSVDCDGCAGTSYYTLPANSKAIDAKINHCYHWADGAMSFTLQPPSRPQPSRFRDYGAEAFEDGHAHVLYV